MRAERAGTGDGADAVFVLVPLRAQGTLRHPCGVEPVRPGHVVLIPGDIPFEVVHEIDSRLVLVVLTQARDILPGRPRRVTSYALDPVAGLLAGTLPRLSAAAGARTRPDDGLDEVVRATIGALVGDRPGGPGLRSAIDGWIARHLTDPGLDAGAAAAALGIYPRPPGVQPADGWRWMANPRRRLSDRVRHRRSGAHCGCAPQWKPP